MKLNIPNLSASASIVLLVLISVLDVFLPEEHPQRFYAMFIQGVLLCFSIYFLLKTYLVSMKKTEFHAALLAFFFMIVVYGMLTPNFRILPVLLYAIAYFYLAYYLTYKGLFQLKHIQTLSVFLLIIYSYETYLSLFSRSERFGDFFLKADNVGYSCLALMVLLSFELSKTKNILLVSFVYFLVILSFKRGAILSGTLVYALAMWPIITGKLVIARDAKKYLFIMGAVAAGSMLYLVNKHWTVIAYRFISDEAGGSGRALFWSEIVRGWSEADILNKIFGFGLFAVPEFLASSRYGSAVYAHSDWYQLLYDHGIVGIAIYIVLIISAIMQRNLVRKYCAEYYYVYLMFFAVWIPKSYYSGFYINKVSIFSMLVLGFILGVANRRKSARYAV